MRVDFDSRLREATKRSLQAITVPRMPTFKRREAVPALPFVIVVLGLLAVWLTSNKAIANGFAAMSSTFRMIVTDALGHTQTIDSADITMVQALALRDVRVVAPRGLPADVQLQSIHHFNNGRIASVLFEYRSGGQLLTIMEEPATNASTSAPKLISYSFGRRATAPGTLPDSAVARGKEFTIQVFPRTFVQSSTRITVVSPNERLAQQIERATSGL